MRCKSLTFLLTVWVLSTITLPTVHGTIYVPKTTAHFSGATPGHYLNFNTAQTFDTVQKVGSYWYFDGKGIMIKYANVTISNWITSNWINYTVEAAISEQRLYYFEEPSLVLLNGIEQEEGHGWTHDAGTVIVTGASTSAALYWGDIPEPPPPPPYEEEEETFESFQENIYVSLNEGDSIGLGSIEPGSYVLITITDGSINSTVSELDAGLYQGSWTFRSNASGSIEVSDPEDDYDLSTTGAMVKDSTTGYVTLDYLADEYVTIYWSSPLEPILPFGFIMGMVGLVSTFGGSMWMIKKAKDHEWNDAITQGFIIAIIGISLFIAWLWGA